MRETIVCPTFLIAKALSRMDWFYRIWEWSRESPIPAIRAYSIAAKAHGIVWYDRTMACATDHEEAPKK